MTGEDFLRSPDAFTVLMRAHRAAGAPVCIHWFRETDIADLIASTGACAVCRYVSAHPRAVEACRESREPAALRAAQRCRAIPFVCHMGLACVSVGTLPGLPAALTIGPYCPSEGAQSLFPDARARLVELGMDPGEQLDQLLEDIHVAPASAIPEIAEWAADNLREKWKDPEFKPMAAERESVESQKSVRTTTKKAVRVPATPLFTAIAVALAAGHRAQVRRLIHSALRSSEASLSEPSGRMQSRALQILGGVLETGEQAGLAVDAIWSRLPEFAAGLRTAKTRADVAAALLDLLKPAAGKTSRRTLRTPSFEQFTRVVSERLAERLTLGEVARILGENPSTITRRLQRTFGISFSEYLGRLRVERAKDLLICTKLTVDEIAQRAGVGSGAAMNRLFRKFEGRSPGSFRAGQEGKA